VDGEAGRGAGWIGAGLGAAGAGAGDGFWCAGTAGRTVDVGGALELGNCGAGLVA
jgi:hypothetical protein